MNELQRIESEAPAPVTPSSTAVAILDVISRAARDPSIDIAKMERLMAMQERVLAKEAEMAFASAMQAAQSEMPFIKNDSRNQQTNSTYAKVKTLNKLAVPIYTKHGFSLSFGTGEIVGDFVRVTCKVRHNQGHSQDYQADVPLDLNGPKGMPNKTRTHAFGSSASYGRRYLTMLIFNISTTDDDDGNAAGGAGGSEESVTALKAELWNLLKPVRGGENDWNIARRWLTDECIITPEMTIGSLSAADLILILQKTRKKMADLNIKPLPNGGEK